MTVKAGDRIIVESERAGQAAREGEVLKVLAPGPNQHYQVRWSDGHESTFFPTAGNATFLSTSRRAAPAKR